MRTQDRRDLATLGLILLGYGLVVSPLAHALLQHGAGSGHAASEWVTHGHTAPAEPLGPHDEQRPHSHSQREDAPQAPSHTHGLGSVEHLLAVAVAPPRVLPPSFFWIALEAMRLGAERARAGDPLPLTAMPQGP